MLRYAIMVVVVVVVVVSCDFGGGRRELGPFVCGWFMCGCAHQSWTWWIRTMPDILFTWRFEYQVSPEHSEDGFSRWILI
jgi:hypothetical protein